MNHHELSILSRLHAETTSGAWEAKRLHESHSVVIAAVAGTTPALVANVSNGSHADAEFVAAAHAALPDLLAAVRQSQAPAWTALHTLQALCRSVVRTAVDSDASDYYTGRAAAAAEIGSMVEMLLAEGRP